MNQKSICHSGVSFGVSRRFKGRGLNLVLSGEGLLGIGLVFALDLAVNNVPGGHTSLWELNIIGLNLFILVRIQFIYLSQNVTTKFIKKRRAASLK